jgi:subtilisin family serine protease
MIKKRGQLTIFILLGIFIIFLIFILLSSKYNKEEIKATEDTKTKEIEEAHNTIKSCLYDTTIRIFDLVGNEKGLIKEHLKMNAQECFKTKEPEIKIEITLPLEIEIKKIGNSYLINIEIKTKITLDNYTSNIEKYSFNIYEKEEINLTQNINFIQPQKAEIMHLYKNITEEKEEEKEFIIEYNYIPENLTYFEDIMDSIPIIKRDFLFNLSEIKELIKEQEILDIVINRSYDEKITYNTKNITFEEIESYLGNFDFIKSISSETKYKILNTQEDFKEIKKISDSYFHYQWYLENNADFFGKNKADINIKEAWEITKGNNNVIISVIDQGIFKNKDFEHSIIYQKSYNFLDDNTDIIARNPSEYHASHVIGLISSKVDNNYGIAGICPECKIMNFKVSNSKGEINSENLIKAVLKSALNGADIISLSLGGEKYSPYEQSIFSQIANKGVIIVAAAGNNGQTKMIYPAAYNGIISVGATNNLDKKASFSNYGPWVNIYAPGESIISVCGQNKFCFDSGTSMATPIAAATIGLMLSINPKLKTNEILTILENTGEKIDYDKTRINAGDALKSLINVTEEIITEEKIEEIKEEIIDINTKEQTIKDKADETEIDKTKIDQVILKIQSKRKEITDYREKRKELIENTIEPANNNLIEE